MKRKSPYVVLGVILVALFVGLFIKQEYWVGFRSALASTSEPPKGCPTSGSPFEISISKMPFPGPTPHDIDGLCPRSGKASATSTHGIQNAAKNNFLAPSPPVEMTFDDFTSLQTATSDKITKSKTIQLDKEGYPNNRGKSLQNQITVHGKPIGEGTLVTLEAYVFTAHYSNTKFNIYPGNKPGTGESNNCDCDKIDWNDIHIALTETDDTKTNECSSVTAEISPHYRSLLWSKFHDGGIARIQSVLPGLLKGRVVQHHAAGDQPVKVKVTGPLFYDASHQPCEFKPSGAVLKSHSPARRTIWEIHPIYHIQVWDKNKWVNLEDWAQGQ